MKKYEVVIIGGGAAGMMAALQAAKNHTVVLIEKNPVLGRKILATGNGRCNVTNRLANTSHYHDDSKFIRKVLQSFNTSAVMKFFENLGVVLKEEDNGRIFPRTNSAQTIVDCLVDQLLEEKVIVRTELTVKKIIKIDGDFRVVFANQDEINAENIIVAMGGKSSPQFGTTGDGYYLAHQLGHRVTETYPALVPIETVETWPAEISGLKVTGLASLTIDGKKVAEKSGDILFTHFGLSAPAIMALAGNIGPSLGKDIKIHLDLFPDKTVKELDQLLTSIFNVSGKKTLKNALSGIIPANLAATLLTIQNLPADRKSAEINKTERLEIAELLKDIALTVKQLRPLKESQVTHGGIELDDIDVKTLQSKKTPGLYFAGEILNVDGDSGGYNLQWAWSSGHLAGQLLK